MILNSLVRLAARSYIAGPDLSDAIALARSLERDSISSTIAYWNSPGDQPANVCSAYMAAIDTVADANVNAYISVKAPALSMSSTFAAALATRCRDRGVGLHFDSLAIVNQAPTLELLQRLAPVGATLGCTLPARFANSLRDVDLAVAQGFRVRVVKGQWDDPTHAVEPRRGFMALVNRLAGRATRVQVATHDGELAEEALTVLAKEGTPAELELLLGLPVREAREVAQRLKVSVRLYIPYGRAWLPYALSTALKQPRVLRWFAGDLLSGRKGSLSRRP